MPKSRRCCIFVLILGGMHLVTGYVSISGCSGESATLYRGISLNSDTIVFNLYKNGYNDTLLAMWSKVKESYQNGYGKKLSLENGTIRIHNLSKSDEGKYVLQPALGDLSMKIEVHLVVLVALPKQCTPNITRVQNTLVASLDNKDCGNPAAHVSWYKFNASNRSRPARKLNKIWKLKGKTKSKIDVGKEADTYCACAKSSAAHCVKRFDNFDFCSCFKIEKDNILTTLTKQPEMTTWSELSDLTKRTSDIHAELLELPDLIKGILALLIILIFAFLIVAMIILYRRWKDSSPSGNQKLSEVKGTPETAPVDSEVSSPSGNQKLSEAKGTPETVPVDSEDETKTTGSACSESKKPGLRSPGSCKKISKSPSNSSNVGTAC